MREGTGNGVVVAIVAALVVAGFDLDMLKDNRVEVEEKIDILKDNGVTEKTTGAKIAAAAAAALPNAGIGIGGGASILATPGTVLLVQGVVPVARGQTKMIEKIGGSLKAASFNGSEMQTQAIAALAGGNMPGKGKVEGNGKDKGKNKNDVKGKNKPRTDELQEATEYRKRLDDKYENYKQPRKDQYRVLRKLNKFDEEFEEKCKETDDRESEVKTKNEKDNAKNVAKLMIKDAAPAVQTDSS